jgi:hypothetical protein
MERRTAMKSWPGSSLLATVAIATALSVLQAPAFADQLIDFSIANYPASQDADQYNVGGVIEWDAAANNVVLSGGFISITPSGGQTLSASPPLGQAYDAGLPPYAEVVGNTLDLLVPAGGFFSLDGSLNATTILFLSWNPGSSTYEAGESSSQSFQFLFQSSPPSPLDAFGLPSNGPWVIGTAPIPYIPGDVDHNGIVNGQDIALIASEWLQTGPNVPGDANGDGIVNAQDIEEVASYWLWTWQGPPAGGGGSAVPEPSSFALLAIGVAIFALTRRLRTSR